VNAGIQARAERLAYPLRLAFDCTTKRPGCVLLQAALGGSSEAAALFSTDLWLLAPTPEFKVYPVRDAQMLQALIQISTTAHPKPPKRRGRRET